LPKSDQKDLKFSEKDLKFWKNDLKFLKKDLKFLEKGFKRKIIPENVIFYSKMNRIYKRNPTILTLTI